MRRALVLPLVLGLAFLYTFGVESYACHDHGTEAPDTPCAVCQLGTAHKVLLPENPISVAAPRVDPVSLLPGAVAALPDSGCRADTRPRAPPLA